MIDVAGLDINGYEAVDWLRAHQRIDMGLRDHRRVEATLPLADDDKTATRLLSGLSALVDAAPGLRRATTVDLPSLPR
jgi:arginine decarboxylase